MPEGQYRLESVISESAKLMGQIANARQSLNANSEAVDQLVKERSILNESKRNITALFNDRDALQHNLQRLVAQRREVKDRVAALRDRLQWTQFQTETTESYLMALDQMIEEAFREEERRVTTRTQTSDKKMGREQYPHHEDHDDREEHTHSPWTRDEEVEYLRLEESQRELLSLVDAYKSEINEKKKNLKSMLDTIVEGEHSVHEKRKRCDALEQESLTWKVKLEESLFMTGTPLHPTTGTQEEEEEEEEEEEVDDHTAVDDDRHDRDFDMENTPPAPTFGSPKLVHGGN